MTCSLALLPTLGAALRYDWFILWYSSVVIGQSDSFGSGFTTLN